ncbi:MAG: leucyl aminopeptidase family protein [Planctomycetota bacterium]
MQFSFPRDGKALAAAAHVLVLAPKACFGPRARGAAALTRHLPRDAAALAQRLGHDTAPGLLGALATTLAQKQRLTVGVLPDDVSRHNSPARAESIRKLVAGAGLAPDGKNAVLVVLDDDAHAAAAANAIGRALPTFTKKSQAKRGGSLAIALALRSGKAVAVDAATQHLVATARLAAELVDTPPTELDPQALAAAAKKALRTVRGVRIQELVGDALLQKGRGGIHAVGRCARSAPRLLVATCGPRRGRHIALVGKGVTYDTGGLHLKARGAMETMKGDMGGAAAVLGAFLVLARSRPAHRLSLVLCMAENAIGPAAYKPDDVLTMHSGMTVEINNTDAEGRLLLADGCSWAARVLGADTILDAATLTGAQGIATGDVHAAVVSSDEHVEQALLAAGRATGDLCWPLPFAPEFYRSEFASPIADMRNSVKNRSNAQSSCAAIFVHWHLDGTKVRWGHVDLAFPAFRGDRGTGFGVALLADAVRRLAK